MHEHAHGESEALVAVWGGRIEITTGDGGTEELEPGAVAVIGIGERVRLENPSPSEPAELLVIFAPPAFVETLSSWPEAPWES
jgi:quercetin dioxygenase-like cupin family protein